MFHAHVTDAQNVLELGVNIPSVFVDRGQVEEADSNRAHKTHKLAAFKDVEDEIFKKHGDGLEEQCIHGGNPQQVKLPFMVEKQIKKWSVDLFMNEDDELTEEVTSVAAPDSGVSVMCHNFFVLTVTLCAVEKYHIKKKASCDFLALLHAITM